MRKVLTLLLASAVVGAPLAASQRDLQRTSQPADDVTELAGNSNLLFILGIAAVAAGVILLQEDEEGAPISA